MNTSPMRNRLTRSTASGFSLIELMVSLTLGLLIVSGMLALLARNSETRGEIEKAGRQIENGRYAVQRLTEDIHHAGYYGEFYDLPAGTVLPTNACDLSLPGLKTAMSFPIQAFTAAATPPSCINAANFVAGSNVLVLRFVSPATTLAENWASADLATTLAPGVVYIQPYVEGVNFATLSTAAAAFNGMVAGAGGVAVSAPIYRYITRIYFISPCSRPVGANCSSAADDGVPIPTLKMVELGSNGTAGLSPTFTNGTASAFSATPVSVAEGVERLEYDYGLDAVIAPDGAPHGAFVNCSPCTAAEWRRVVSVRINLLARNAERSAGYTDVKTYDMGLSGAASAPGNANYKRHVFQVIVRLNNQSMRKEQ